MRVPASRSDEGLLTEDTCVEVVYRKDDERFVLSWSQNGEAHPIARLDGDEPTPQEGDIRERFPVRIYSQKQLFALAQDPNALLTVIDDSQSVRGAERNRSVKQLADRYLSLRAGVREARNLANELPARRAVLADIRHKLEVLQKGGHAQALSEYRVLRQQDDTWQVILHGASQAVVEVGKAAQELSVADLDLGTNVEDDQPREDLQRAHESLRRTIERLQQGVREAVKEARRDIEAIQGGTEIERWHEALDASEKAFQAASTRLAEEGMSDQNQYGSLLEQGAALERNIEGLEGEAERARMLEDDAGKALTEYRQKRDELSDRRQRFVRETSSEIIHVEIDALSNYGNLADKLSETLGIERFEDDRQAIALRIRNEQGGSWDWDRLDAVVAEMRQFLSES